MCRVSLKKIENKPSAQEVKPLELPEFQGFEFSNYDLKAGMPLFDEPLLSSLSIPSLFTPNTIQESEAVEFPFPSLPQEFALDDLVPPTFEETSSSSSPIPSVPASPQYYHVEPQFIQAPVEMKREILPKTTAGVSVKPEVVPCTVATKKKIIHNPSITEEKRQRNRLAAEKYRQKGRDQISTLEKKCQDLCKDNDLLKARNVFLEDEIQTLRSILLSAGILKTDSLPQQAQQMTAWN